MPPRAARRSPDAAGARWPSGDRTCGRPGRGLPSCRAHGSHSPAQHTPPSITSRARYERSGWTTIGPPSGTGRRSARGPAASDRQPSVLALARMPRASPPPRAVLRRPARATRPPSRCRHRRGEVSRARVTACTASTSPRSRFPDRRRAHRPFSRTHRGPSSACRPA